MTDVRDWLAARRPEPPEGLAAGLESVAGADGLLVDALTTAARARLDEARGRPGRVRESAFRLLEADALLTYACEAALESEDPETALRSILASIGT